LFYARGVVDTKDNGVAVFEWLGGEQQTKDEFVRKL